MYGSRKDGPDQPPENVPARIENALPHSPLPMLKNFSSFLEDQFPDWFAFVRSHKFRFQCCDASKKATDGGVAELFGWMYPAMLYKHGVGVQTKLRGFICYCIHTDCIEDQLARRDLTYLTVQNC